MLQLPIIDLSRLSEGPSAKQLIAAQLDQACRDCGFFYLVGHGVPVEHVDSKVGRVFPQLRAATLVGSHHDTNDRGDDQR